MKISLNCLKLAKMEESAGLVGAEDFTASKTWEMRLIVGQTQVTTAKYANQSIGDGNDQI
jgi:hypothetical protein